MNDEDSLILEKNRGLDEADTNVIKDIIDIFQLREVSVFSLYDLHGGQDCEKVIVREVNGSSFSA